MADERIPVPFKAPQEVDPGTYTMAELLRRHGRVFPESHRVYLALKAGPLLLDDSPLGECIEAGHLPEATGALLRAALVLQWTGATPEEWGALRDAVRGGFRLLKGGWDGLGDTLPSDDPDADAFRTVARRFDEFAQAAQDALRVVESAGYRWNPDGGGLEALPGPEGGHPRTLLRELVQALMEYRLRAHLGADNTVEVREWLAAELAPFFHASLLDTRKESPFRYVVRRALGD